MERTQLVIGKLGVNLYLVDRRGYSRLCNQTLQVVDLEVRNPHGTGGLIELELQKSAPSLHEISPIKGGKRPVDQK